MSNIKKAYEPPKTGYTEQDRCHLQDLENYTFQRGALSSKRPALWSFVTRRTMDPTCHLLLEQGSVCLFVVRLLTRLVCSDSPSRSGRPATLHQSMSEALAEPNALLIACWHIHFVCECTCPLVAMHPGTISQRRSAGKDAGN